LILVVMHFDSNIKELNLVKWEKKKKKKREKEIFLKKWISFLLDPRVWIYDIKDPFLFIYLLFCFFKYVKKKIQ